MIDRWERACAAVEDGITSPAEVRRVLGVATIPEPTRARLAKKDPLDLL